MSDSPTIALVCLSFDEVEGVRALAPRLADAKALRVDTVFAVDPGSTDGTLEEFAKHNIPVVPQALRGRGEAMRVGIEHTDCTHVIFFSPDGNEDLDDVPRFRPLFELGYDLVIASRMMRGAHNEEDDQWIRPRKWVNNLFNLAANLLYRRQGPYVTDSINGFRGLRGERFAQMGLKARGYTIEYQMTMRAMQHRLKIAEFPTHEGQRIGGATKAPSFKTGLQFIACLFKEIIGRRD